MGMASRAPVLNRQRERSVRKGFSSHCSFHSWKHRNDQGLCKCAGKEDVSNSQRRLSKNRAGQTNFIFCDEVINLVDEGGTADIIYMGIYVRILMLHHMVSL